MIDDPYSCFVAGIQAARRKVEGLGPAIGGALGVAAEPYPHQIAAVKRILTDTRIRHLISDEVGLGKTVQTLMILNALRYQNPSHRTVILVPDRLVSQWFDECWARAHTRPAIVEEPSDLEEPFVRIVRPQSLQSGNFQLDPDEYDMLIVDEPQIMPVEVMEQVERAAGRFRQMLVLSATPGLGDPQKRQRIMTLLEPERTGRAVLEGADPEAVLLELERVALAEIAEHPENAPLLFNIYGRGRRIIRATRAAWGRYLPRRRYERIEPDTLEGEERRVRLGLEWLAAAPRQEAGIDKWRAAQALHRGTPSARALVRSRADERGKLAEALSVSAATPGDSRLDALVEVMADIWRQAPDEQILVVAGDNPTIDFLAPRIARNFRKEDGDLEVATLRRLSEALENEAADIAAMHAQLAAFSSGRAKVLLIGEWIQAGLNLHYFARNIIFYSSPWDPDAIDQLIGRLDRLRPNGLHKGDSGAHFGNIRVWTVVQADTPEDRVVRGLEAVGVYERPLPPLSSDDAQMIRGTLEQIAFRNDSTGEQQLGKLADEWSAAPGLSLLDEFSPFTPKAAQAEYDRLQATELPRPVLLGPADASYSSKAEYALDGWLKFISRAGFFQVIGRKDRNEEQVRFSTIWYPEGGERKATIRLSDIPRGNWMTGHLPFITRRRDMSRPPRNFVHTDEGEPRGRLLRFLDHGDAVHDELVEGFIAHAKKVCTLAEGSGRTVMFDERHPALPAIRGKALLAAAAFIDPAKCGLPQPDLDEMRLRMELAPTTAQRAALKADLDMTMEWWRSDQRWLRSELPPALLLSVLHLSGNNWEAVPDEIAWSVIDPLITPKDAYCARSRGNPLVVAANQLSSGRDKARTRLLEQAHAVASREPERLKYLLRQRTRQVVIEMDDFIAFRQAEVERRRQEPIPQQEQLQQLRTGRIAAAERRVEMAISAKEARLDWLDRIPSSLAAAQPLVLGEIMLRAVPADLT